MSITLPISMVNACLVAEVKEPAGATTMNPTLTGRWVAIPDSAVRACLTPQEVVDNTLRDRFAYFDTKGFTSLFGHLFDGGNSPKENES